MCAYSWCVRAHGVCVFMVFVCIYAFCVMLGPLCHGTQAQRPSLCLSSCSREFWGWNSGYQLAQRVFFYSLCRLAVPLKFYYLYLFVCVAVCYVCTQTFMPLNSWRSEDSLHRFCRQVFLWTTSSQMETYIKAWPAAQSCPTSSSD